MREKLYELAESSPLNQRKRQTKKLMVEMLDFELIYYQHLHRTP